MVLNKCFIPFFKLCSDEQQSTRWIAEQGGAHSIEAYVAIDREQNIVKEKDINITFVLFFLIFTFFYKES